MAEQLIDITEPAQDYLRDLLGKQDQGGREVEMHACASVWPCSVLSQ